MSKTTVYGCIMRNEVRQFSSCSIQYPISNSHTIISKKHFSILCNGENHRVVKFDDQLQLQIFYVFSKISEYDNDICKVTSM